MKKYWLLTQYKTTCFLSLACLAFSLRYQLCQNDCNLSCVHFAFADKTMGNAVLWWSSLSARLVSVCLLCASVGEQCQIRNEMADCSHLKLTQIPSDLPTNITGLDISHNQLRQLGPANLTKYSQLVYLNAGYNSISKLQPELCQSVPLLRILKLEHNELYKLPDRVFASCTNLTELNLGYNKIDIKNDPFKTLEVSFRNAPFHVNKVSMGNLLYFPVCVQNSCLFASENTQHIIFLYSFSKEKAILTSQCSPSPFPYCIPSRHFSIHDSWWENSSSRWRIGWRGWCGIWVAWDLKIVASPNSQGQGVITQTMMDSAEAECSVSQDFGDWERVRRFLLYLCFSW